MSDDPADVAADAPTRAVVSSLFIYRLMLSNVTNV